MSVAAGPPRPRSSTAEAEDCRQRRGGPSQDLRRGSSAPARRASRLPRACRTAGGRTPRWWGGGGSGVARGRAAGGRGAAAGGLTTLSWAFGASGLARCGAACGRGPSPCGRSGLTCERLPGCGAAPLTLQSSTDRGGAPGRRSRPSSCGAAGVLRTPLRLALGSCRRPRQFHPGAARLRQADGNRLFGGSGAVFSFTHVVNLFADERARLRCRGSSSALRFTCALNRPLLRHGKTSRIMPMAAT